MPTIDISQQDETITLDTADDITIDIDAQPDVTIDVSVTDTATITVEAIGLPGIPGPPGGVTVHGDLFELDKDDHPQYLTKPRADLLYDIIGATQVNFAAPQSVWNINIGHTCNVIVVNSAGDVVEPGQIKYNGTAVQLTFSAPFSGTAYCF